MKKQQKFRPEEPRYMTKGIAEELPILYQILLWGIIDKLRDSGQRMDYLQVFRLKTTTNPDREGKLLSITHSQERPRYEKEYILPVSKDSESISGKIFVIDDAEYATMLWSDEY